MARRGTVETSAPPSGWRTTARCAEMAIELVALVRPGDVVVLHDPQPAGLAPQMLKAGAIVVWRCHVGCDTPNQWTERSWAFLRPYLDPVHGYVFSSSGFRT